MTKQELKDMACAAIDKHSEQIIALGDNIFNEPELGFKEFKTAEKVSNLFEALGFSYRNGVAVTGVVAELKGSQSKMKVAIMGELDAVVSPQHPNADPATGAAHACGHNCMIAALAGVAYALGKTEVMKHLAGDVSLMAVPAEEYVEIEYRKSLIDSGKTHFVGGKQEFIYLGEMDNIDIMMMHHNQAEKNGVVACAGYTTNGFMGKLVQYVGKAAHSGGAPHKGINALNAANIGLMAVHAQRETFMDADHVRVHPIITKGGDLVNIVPEDVRIETYIRGASLPAIMDAQTKVDRAFKAGGDAVGAKTNITTLPGYLPFVLHNPLLDIMYENQVSLFGKDRVVHTAPPLGGSTDAGDVSQLMPTIHCGFAGMEGEPHGPDLRITDKDIGMIGAAKGLVMTLIDLLAENAETGLSVKNSFHPPMTKEKYLKDWGNHI